MAHVEGGNEQQMERPLSWDIWSIMEGVGSEWAVSGSVAWIGLAPSYLTMPKSSEVFTGDDGEVHAVYCLKGGILYGRATGRGKKQPRCRYG